MTIPASKSWSKPSATGLLWKNGGTGKPNIMCPMEKYMSISRKISDAIRRFNILGVSVSLKLSSAGAATAFFSPLTEAP